VFDDAEIVDGPKELPPEGDMRLFSFRVRHGDARHDKVVVAIPAAQLPSSPDDAVRLVDTKGRAAVERELAVGRIPTRIATGWFSGTFFAEEEDED
jgi:hypothetical protein